MSAYPLETPLYLAARVMACLVPVLSLMAAAAEPDATGVRGPDEHDLLALQGRWERDEPKDSAAPYRRMVKDVKGNAEVVAYYRADGSLWRAHHARFKLSRTGGVKVFTFSDVLVTDGDGKGARSAGPSSYIYAVNETQFKEASGFLPGQEAQPPSVIVWERAKGQAGQVAARPAPDPQLQGTWKPFHSEEGGVDRMDRASYLVKFEGERFTILRDGRLMLRGTFTTYAGRDAGREARRIDLLLLEDADNAANAGRTMRGIYSVDGGELRWCTGTTAAPRPPTMFTTRDGEPYMLVLMRQVPPQQG